MEPQSLSGSPKRSIGETPPPSSADCFHDDESNNNGSVWDDLDDDMIREPDLAREWKIRRQQFYNHGYREGISAGKNDSAQEGFNGGFKDSVLVGYNWGLVRGVTNALAKLPEELRKKLIETEEDRRELKSLHELERAISTEAALKVFYNEMNRKKTSAESVGLDVDQQSVDQISDSIVLGNHFQKLQVLLQRSPELEVLLEKKGKSTP